MKRADSIKVRFLDCLETAAFGIASLSSTDIPRFRASSSIEKEWHVAPLLRRSLIDTQIREGRMICHV